MIKLIKTNGGSNGSPENCKNCGQSNFLKTGASWYCGNCGTYFMTELKSKGIESLEGHLKELDQLGNRLKKLVEELERMIEG